MKPWKTFVHYFVPNKINKYRPLLLRAKIAGIIVLIVFVLFAFSAVLQRILVTSNSSQVAAVIAASLVNFANTDRAQNNLVSLTVSSELQAAAQAKANDMAAGGYFAHVSPTGRDPWYWFTQAGYAFSYGGENLAVYFSDSSAVNTAWMNSPEHRANILNGHFTQIGVATAEGVYQGHKTTFVVQEFGTPAATGTVAKQTVATISPKSSGRTIVATKNAPTVKGASIASPQVKVITQDKNFIAVENENVPAQTVPPTAASVAPTPKPNPVFALLLKFVTSPKSDLAIAYGIIGALVALALVFEITNELKRPRPHRIVIGLSLIVLMVALLFVGDAFIFRQLLIT